MDQVYLSRRNLLSLLSKLDRKRAGEASACTIIKNDAAHEKYPQSMEQIAVTALEDEEYYDRPTGPVYAKDDPDFK